MGSRERGAGETPKMSLMMLVGSRCVGGVGSREREAREIPKMPFNDARCVGGVGGREMGGWRDGPLKMP